MKDRQKSRKQKKRYRHTADRRKKEIDRTTEQDRGREGEKERKRDIQRERRRKWKKIPPC